MQMEDGVKRSLRAVESLAAALVGTLLVGSGVNLGGDGVRAQIARNDASGV